MTAAELYLAALAALVLVAAVAGAVDYGRHLRRRPTISAWLRKHPAWFWVPAAVVVASLIVFTLHLWVFHP